MRQGMEQLQIGMAQVAAPPATGIKPAPAKARSWPRSARLWAAVLGAAPAVLWSCVSVGLFAGIWEACWALGWADPKLLPPPHIFLGDIADQAKFFNTVSRWQVGVGQNLGPSPAMAVIYTVLSTTGRVFAGLGIAASLAITIGVAIRYFTLFERLTLPTVTLLAPVSPIAWCRSRSFCSASATSRRYSWS
jgi:NitT/TauT family transport system permease protein